MTKRLILMVLVAAAALAQQNPNAPLRLGESLLHIPTPRLLAGERAEVRFTHRFQTPINEGDVHSLWGLDGSADIGLGLSWQPHDRLLLSLFRSDVLDDYELAAKFVLLDHRKPFQLSVRGGADVRTEKGLEDRVSGFAQVLVARRIGTKGEIFLAPSVVSNTEAFDYVFNVPVAFAWSLYPHLSLIAEFTPENTDLPDGIDSSFGWCVGLTRAIGGHYFEIILGNTRATNVDQYVPSMFLGTGLDSSDVHLGFNIERRFGTTRK